MPDIGSPIASVASRFAARPEGLAELHDAFDRFYAASASGGAAVAAVDRVAMVTAAAEVAANIVGYACRNLPEAQVTFALSRWRDRIETRFEDPGLPWAEGQHRDEKDDDVPHLGMGLSIAKASVTDLEYSREDDTNHWRLVRMTEAS